MLSVVKKVVLKRHVVRIPFPVNLAVNLRSVHFDQDEGCKQPRKKDVVYLATGLVIGDNEVLGVGEVEHVEALLHVCTQEDVALPLLLHGVDDGDVLPDVEIAVVLS